MYGLLFMSSIQPLATTFVPTPQEILVPTQVLKEPAAMPADTISSNSVEQATQTPSISPAQAVFEARQNLEARRLATQVNSVATEVANGITTSEEVAQVATSTDLAEGFKQVGLKIAASLVDDKDRKFIALVAKVLISIECEGKGVEVDSIAGTQKVIGAIQDIYVTAQQTKHLDANAAEGAIRNQLKSLGLSKEQKAAMQDYFKQVLGGGNATTDSMGLDALKNLALSKEGMLAVGTALYVLSSLVAQIPVVGNLLATPIKLVQGLLGTAKDIIPMVLLMQRDGKAAPATQIQSSMKQSSVDSKPAPAKVAAA